MPRGRSVKRYAGTLGVIGVFLLLPAISALPRAQEADREALDTDLEDFAWLAGSWQGPGPGGTTAEIHFMQPEAGTLPSLFRLWQDDRLLIIEAITLVEEADGLFMYVRHFDPHLVPAEEDHAIKLRLAKRVGDSYHFVNVHDEENPRRSVMRRTDRGFESRSELARSDGTVDQIRVRYERVGRR